MSRSGATRFLLAAALLSIGLPATAGPLDDQVKQAYAAWNGAFNRGDAKAVAAFYTGDTSFLPATHDVILTRDGVETFFSALFASGVTGHALDLINASGDNAIIVAAARWSATGRDASGKEARFSGVATHVFERQPDGSLKLKLHTFN